MGTQKAGYATVSLDEVMETKALLGIGPEGWTNCITEGFAMKTDKKLNIFTDSKCDSKYFYWLYHVLQIHAAIWK